MSDQLAAAAEAMNVPQPIVERSARARAAASGASYEDVLVAWAGGAAVAASAPTPEPEPLAEAEPVVEETAEEPAAPEAALPSTPAVPEYPAAAAVVVEPEPEVEPLPLGERVGLAGRIGAWTGTVLGLLALVLGSTWMLGLASVAGEEGAYVPAVEVLTSRFLLGVTLVSIVFGVVVAAVSRAAAGWVDEGARLEGRASATVAMGAVLGLVLGLAAGAVMLAGFGEPIEGAEEATSLLRVVPSVFVVLVGGAFLGWITAILVQVIGVPAGVDEEEAAEITDVRGRLSAAVSIPVAAVVLLALLVLPLGIVFIRSNEMASGGAAVLAVFAAGAILGVSAMAASRPTMRITFGEFLVAVAGIATVVLIIFAIIQTQSGPHEEESAEETPAADEALAFPASGLMT
jgi:MFS family permease